MPPPLLERAEELVWVVDCLDDIASDLSVFHRVDDPMELPSSRYFLLAERLIHYDGAVRAAVTRMIEDRQQPAADAPADPPTIPGVPAGAQVIHLSDAEAAAAATQSAEAIANGFPTVAYLHD